MTATRAPRREARGGFRTDIQGMRAIAVMLVLLFHMGLPYIRGGYVGVDVFYVISGFLITGLLVREVEATGKLSLVRFYARRMKRLAPTALLVLIVTAAALWFGASRLEAAVYLPDIAAAALYASNIAFSLKQTGYFASESVPSPVLHFWSLAVEEQFYLLWPVIVLVVAWAFGRRLFRRRLATVLTLLVVASLLASVILTPAYPQASFYLLHTRAWQLGVGGLLALAAPRLRPAPALRTALAVMGLVLVVVSAFVFDAHTGFPGWAAVVPTAGGALLLAAGCDGPAPFIGRLLSSAPMRFLGDISYSLYVWHWPLLVLPVLFLGRPLRLRESIALGAAAIVVAFVSYRLLESPIHRARGWQSGRHLLAFVAATVAVGLLAATGAVAADRMSRVKDGSADEIGLMNATRALPAAHRLRYAGDDFDADGRLRRPGTVTPKLPDVAKSLAPVFTNGCARLDTREIDPDCWTGSGSKTIVVFGDSLAGQWQPAFDVVAKVDGYRVLYLIKNACPSVPLGLTKHPTAGAYPCREVTADSLRRVQELKPAVVVIANSDMGYQAFPELAGTDYQANWLAKERQLVASLPRESGLLYLSPTQSFPADVTTCLSRNAQSPEACSQKKADLEAFRAAQRAVVEQAGGTYLAMQPLFCAGGTCPAVVASRILPRDVSHLTVPAARLAAPVLGDAVRRAAHAR